MSVDEVYQIMLFIATKNKTHGGLPRVQFNLIINQASRSYQNSLIGPIEQFQIDRPKPRISYGMSQTARNKLTPFIYGYNLHVDTTGLAPYPGNYEDTDAMWTIYGAKRIRFCPQDKFYSIYNSVIDPYQKNPFFMIEDTGFRLFPNDIGTTRLHYIQTAPAIIWGFTTDSQGREVYDPASSADPWWYDTDMFEIMARALAMIGVNISSADVSQYSQAIKQQGQ